MLRWRIQIRPSTNNQCFQNLFGVYTGDEWHIAVDMNRGKGSLICSAHKGTIIGADRDNYGVISIYDEIKDVTYRYYHMDIDQSIVLEKKVLVGDILGKQSNKGIGIPSHLHFEVLKGRCAHDATFGVKPHSNWDQYPMYPQTQSTQALSPYDYM